MPLKLTPTTESKRREKSTEDMGNSTNQQYNLT